MRLGTKPLVVGCVASEAHLRRCARKAPAHCDLIEVRLDLTGLCGGHWLELCAAVQAKGRPVLLTIRDAREGGRWRGPEAERLALYLASLRAVTAVDMEIGAHALMTVAKAAHRVRVQVVGSFHDFKGTPELARLRAVETRGRHMGVDVVKIATRVRKPEDLARLFALPAHAKGPIGVLGMGPRGAISRVALPCAGSCLVYGALGAPTAPGQPTCRELVRDLERWGGRKA
jgi:3-dehydroquinate dehydratase type I